jgi:hypothetical protein
LAEGGADGDVVFHVAREPVDLMYDDGVDVAVLFDARKEGLELWPVDAAGGFAAVDVFVDEGPVGVADARDAGFALGRDGKALVGEVAFGLRGGGYAQVDRAAHLSVSSGRPGGSGRARRPRRGVVVKPSAALFERDIEQRTRQWPQASGGQRRPRRSGCTIGAVGGALCLACCRAFLRWLWWPGLCRAMPPSVHVTACACRRATRSSVVVVVRSRVRGRCGHGLPPWSFAVPACLTNLAIDRRTGQPQCRADPLAPTPTTGGQPTTTDTR